MKQRPTSQKPDASPRFRWLWAFAIAAVLVAGYLLFGRSEHFEPADARLIDSPFPAGRRSAVPPRPTAGAPPFQGGQRSGGSPTGFTMGPEQKVVELNSASLAEIETLPGITPDYAKKIIAGRPYRKIEDLERVGIPHKLLEDISPPAVIRFTEQVSPTPSGPPPRKKP